MATWWVYRRGAGRGNRRFNKSVSVLGRAWVEGSRSNSGAPVYGSILTLWVVIVGQVLVSLDDAANCAPLISKLRKDQPDAHAELQAIHLLRHGRVSIQVECEPELIVGGHNRKPDFRARNETEPWLYVEVTRPSTSIAQRDVCAGRGCG